MTPKAKVVDLKAPQLIVENENKHFNMNLNTMQETVVNLSELKHLKVEFIKNEYVVSLIDEQAFEIVKGYGDSIANALNDLLNNFC